MTLINFRKKYIFIFNHQTGCDNIYQYINTEKDEKLQLVVTLKENFWNGEESIQLQIEDVI